MVPEIESSQHNSQSGGSVRGPKPTGTKPLRGRQDGLIAIPFGTPPPPLNSQPYIQ